MKTPLHLATWLFSLLSISFLATAKADEDALMQAMRAELARAVEQLRMGELEAPYFVAYTVWDTERKGTQASLGALLPSSEKRTRFLSVELRVGDPSFDNTNFLSMSLLSRDSRRTATLPLEDNVVELRRQIWLATDAAYKNALEGLAAKRAALKNATRVEELGDLSPAEPFTHFEEPDRNVPTLLEMQSQVRSLSRLFASMPDIMESTARAAVRHRQIYYVNSEGSAFIRNDPTAYLSVVAQTQAPDGTVLRDFVAAYGHTWDQVPDQDAMTSRVIAMGQALTSRRAAASIDNYIGPVLFEGQAAAELLAQLLVSRLVGLRPPDTEATPGFSLSVPGSPFADKLGARVLARSLSLRDDPTLRGNGFLGGYAVDDDGVPAQATSLVENGVLKTLLTTRNPVRGVDGSTGNRRGSSPAPSNLLLTSRQGISQEEMLAELMLLVEERQAKYGIIVRRMGNPGFQQPPDFRSFVFSSRTDVENSILAYKVYPDGREELIRKTEFSAIADSVFKEIVAASESSTVYTFVYPLPRSTFQIGVPSFNGHLVSVSVPNLLFEEVTLRQPSGNVPHLPVASHPFFGE